MGSTLIGAAAFLMLAAGGNAIENSCAAFNTYGRYNSVTFTVACLRPFSGERTDYKETLLIGADQKVVAELTVYETMEPQTVTVPINGCEQLMFWLANTNNTSGQYVFYDIRLTGDVLPLDIVFRLAKCRFLYIGLYRGIFGNSQAHGRHGACV